MRSLAIACALLLPVDSIAAQEGSSRPTSRPTAAKKPKARQGGFYGISFVEKKHRGEPVLEVQSVVEGTDAQRLGFHAGDRITGVNGRPLENGDDFIRMLYCTLPDDVGTRMSKMMGMDSPEGGPYVDVQRGDKTLRIQGGLADLDASPKVGDHAPDFTLSSADQKNQTTLSDLTGDKPVVLVFGSYT